MKLPDTCIWIEALAGTPTGRRYYAVLQQTSKLIVPTLVQFELRRWCLRAVQGGMAEEIADRAIAAMRATQVLALNEATALYAAELAQRYSLSSVDALIYATALHEKADLLTCDAHFEGLPGVHYQPKVPA